MNLDRDHAHAFLTTVFDGLPGLIQLCSTGNWTGRFFHTTPDGIGQAVDYAARLDATHPAGIYFRATTLRGVPEAGPDGKPRRGGADDTLSVPMMWGDVDYGTEGHKKGEALPPTRDDALRVIRDSAMPQPTILIHSGGGLYPLWVTTHPIPADTAGQVSVDVQLALLAGSTRHGWTYGTGVSDLARVLRLPGSVNRKTATERLCHIVGGTAARVDYTAFPTPDPALLASNPTGVAVRPLPDRRPVDPNRARGAFDVLDEVATWADILTPAGWTFIARESDGAERWRRPGDATSEYSARAFEHNLVCHSESAGLPSGAGQRLTKARVYAYLWYGGDLSAAAVDLIRGRNAGHLPAAVMRDIETTCDPLAGLVPIPNGTAPTPTNPLGVPGAATDDEIALFLTTYTRYQRPDRLGRRTAWLRADEPARIGWHARCMVQDVLDGHYPAQRALDALTDAYRHHGGQDPRGARCLLSVALGAILNSKVSA